MRFRHGSHEPSRIFGHLLVRLSVRSCGCAGDEDRGSARADAQAGHVYANECVVPLMAHQAHARADGARRACAGAHAP